MLLVLQLLQFVFHSIGFVTHFQTGVGVDQVAYIQFVFGLQLMQFFEQVAGRSEICGNFLQFAAQIGISRVVGIAVVLGHFVLVPVLGLMVIIVGFKKEGPLVLVVHSQNLVVQFQRLTLFIQLIQYLYLRVHQIRIV